MLHLHRDVAPAPKPGGRVPIFGTAHCKRARLTFEKAFRLTSSNESKQAHAQQNNEDIHLHLPCPDAINSTKQAVLTYFRPQNKVGIMCMYSRPQRRSYVHPSGTKLNILNILGGFQK